MRSKIIANQHDLNAIQESWFIQNVTFSGAPIDIGFQAPALNGKIIYLELNEISAELISLLRDAGQSIILYHMGDERGVMRTDCYQLCDLVIRNYYFQDKFSENCRDHLIWAPCGFKTGIGPRPATQVKTVLERSYVASFLGWLGNVNSYGDERKKFSGVASSCGENIFVIPSDAFGKGLNVGLYSATMESSVFAPCPAGNSPETIRLYDALELGCIPISLKHEYIFAKNALGEFGDPPIVLLNSWDELPIFLERARGRLINNLNEIQEWQTKCLNWWTSYKSRFQQKISNRINLIKTN